MIIWLFFGKHYTSWRITLYRFIQKIGCLIKMISTTFLCWNLFIIALNNRSSIIILIIKCYWSIDLLISYLLYYYIVQNLILSISFNSISSRNCVFWNTIYICFLLGILKSNFFFIGLLLNICSFFPRNFPFRIYIEIFF